MIDLILTILALLGVAIISVLLELRNMRRNVSHVTSFTKKSLVLKIVSGIAIFYFIYLSVTMCLSQWIGRPFSLDQIFFINAFRLEPSLVALTNCAGLVISIAIYTMVNVMVAGSNKLVVDLGMTTCMFHVLACTTYSWRFYFHPHFSVLYWVLTFVCFGLSASLAEVIAYQMSGMAYQSSHAGNEDMVTLMKRNRDNKHEARAATKAEKRKARSARKAFVQKQHGESVLHQTSPRHRTSDSQMLDLYGAGEEPDMAVPTPMGISPTPMGPVSVVIGDGTPIDDSETRSSDFRIIASGSESEGSSEVGDNVHSEDEGEAEEGEVLVV